jgi:thymidylate kinase
VREGYISAIEALRDKERIYVIEQSGDEQAVSEEIWKIVSGMMD